VEIIHTATLVTTTSMITGRCAGPRDGQFSLGGTFALLTGDYMFTKTYEIMAPYPGTLNAILAKAAIQLVEGETCKSRPHARAR